MGKKYSKWADIKHKKAKKAYKGPGIPLTKEQIDAELDLIKSMPSSGAITTVKDYEDAKTAFGGSDAEFGVYIKDKLPFGLNIDDIVTAQQTGNPIGTDTVSMNEPYNHYTYHGIPDPADKMWTGTLPDCDIKDIKAKEVYTTGIYDSAIPIKTLKKVKYGPNGPKPVELKTTYDDMSPEEKEKIAEIQDNMAKTYHGYNGKLVSKAHHDELEEYLKELYPGKKWAGEADFFTQEYPKAVKSPHQLEYETKATKDFAEGQITQEDIQKMYELLNEPMKIEPDKIICHPAVWQEIKGATDEEAQTVGWGKFFKDIDISPRASVSPRNFPDNDYKERLSHIVLD